MKHEPPVPRPWPLARLLIPAAVGLITLLVFVPSLSCGFVDIDDAKLITENPSFRGLSGEHLGWMFSSTMMGHWQPLTWLSYAVDYSLAGLDPRQFHLTNILLHTADAVLLYLILVRLVRVAMGDRDGEQIVVRLAAALGALYWSIHPLRVESVTWATERRDVLSAFFLLLAALAYFRAFPRQTVRMRSRAWYAASVGLLALSLMSKAWGMSFFAVVLILDWYPLRRLPLNPLSWFTRASIPALVQKLPYVILGILSAAMAGYAQNSIGARRTLADWPLIPRIVQVFYGLVFYPWKTLFPTRLCALYELRHGLNPFAPTYLLCYGIVLAAGAAILLLARRAPWLAAAAGIYAISVAPVLGLFQSGDQFVADRYSYIACMSWSALAAGGVLGLSRRVSVPRRAWAFAAPVLAAAVLVRLTLVQIPTWTDAVTLWRQACQSDPTQVVPHVNYGLSLEVRARQLQQGGHADDARRLYDEALEQYRTATRLNPQDGRGWFPMGNALRRDGDRAGAEAALREAAKYLPQAYLPLVNLAYLLEQDPSRRDEALAAFRQAVDSVEHPRPGSAPSAKPYLALGLALKNRADIPAARDAFTRGLAMAQKLEDEVSIQQARGQLAALDAVR